MRKSVLAVVAVTLLLTLGCEQGNNQRFTVINYSWTTTDTKYLHDNVTEMEKRPFDGVCVFVAHPRREHGSVLSGTYRADLGWSVFWNKRFQPETVEGAVHDLRTTRFRKFRSNYLVTVAFLHTGDFMDWFDDQWWSNITSNAALMAQVAHRGGCEGILFDAEQYRGTLWQYSKLKQQDRYKDVAFEVLAQQVRQRGREYIRAVNQGYPGTRMLLLFAWEWLIRGTEGDHARLSEQRYGLYYYFLEGLLEAADEKTVFIDGVEEYRATEKKDFEALARRVRQDGPKFTTQPENFARKVRVGFGIWMDRGGKWNSLDVEKNSWTPDKFRKAVGYALLASDGFLWIYNERPSWLLDSPEDKLANGVGFGSEGRNKQITWVSPAYDRALKAGRQRAQETAQGK